MVFTLCKIQYVDKIETSFNIRLNNHTSDVSNLNVIPTCCHFAQGNHKFNTHATFTLIETITSQNRPTEVFLDIETQKKKKEKKRRRPGRLLNVLCTFNLRPVPTG